MPSDEDYKALAEANAIGRAKRLEREAKERKEHSKQCKCTDACNRR